MLSKVKGYILEILLHPHLRLLLLHLHPAYLCETRENLLFLLLYIFHMASGVTESLFAEQPFCTGTEAQEFGGRICNKQGVTE